MTYALMLVTLHTDPVSKSSCNVCQMQEQLRKHFFANAKDFPCKTILHIHNKRFQSIPAISIFDRLKKTVAIPW